MSREVRLKYLKGRRLAVFLAVADTVIPPDGADPGGGGLSTAGVVDWAMARLPGNLRRKLLFLLLLLDLLALFFGGRRFPATSRENRERVLSWMENSSLRLLRLGFFGLKTYAAMGYHTREEAWKTIDYSGPLLPDAAYADHDIRILCRGTGKVAR